jgi:hypothetical protein
MRNVLKNWNLLRVIRLVFGVYVLIQGVYTRDMSYLLIGGLFTLMPVLNIGCCSTSGCATPNRKNEITTEDISYEEVR